MELKNFRKKTKSTHRAFNSIRNIWANRRQGRIKRGMYETLQKILDKANKNDSGVVIADVNASVGNCEVTDVVGADGEAALNSNGKKTDRFLHIQ